MKAKQNGFTLIELMIVITIIGVLAAVAMPAYQDYVKRAHVSEGMILATAAKTGIVEYHSHNGTFPNGTGNANSATGLASSGSIVGEAVDDVRVLDDGSGGIQITFNTRVDPVNNTLVIKPTFVGGSFVWDWVCAGGTTVNARYLPANCR